jgi:hypothetical protein
MRGAMGEPCWAGKEQRTMSLQEMVARMVLKHDLQKLGKAIEVMLRALEPPPEAPIKRRKFS